MDFEADFGRWLDASVTQGVPSNVVGFSFNLYEPAGQSGVKFGVELVGTETFDEEDENWPCEEIWEPNPRGINIPIEFSGEDWESCLAAVKRILLNQLDGNHSSTQILKAAKGIGIGFVDGDLEVVWIR